MTPVRTTSVPRVRATVVWVFALTLSYGGGVAAAQGPVAQPGPVARRQAWLPHLRVHAGTPLRASLAVGALRAVRRAGDGSMDAGPLVVVEPGLKGGKVRVGYGASGSFAMGGSIEAAYLRT